MNSKITPRKLDKNSDYKLVQSDSMSDAMNINVLDSNSYPGGSDAGSMGTIKPVPSNMYALGDTPDFSNCRVLSTVTDNKAKLVYYFVWSQNTNGHSVYVYDRYGRLPVVQDDGSILFNPGYVYEVYKSTYLNFPQDGFVKGDIVHINSSTFDKRPDLETAIKGKGYWNDLSSDAILYFTDNKNEPKKINVYRCLYEDVPAATGSDTVDIIQHTLDFISACPRTPLERPLAYFQYDPDFSSSNFSNIEGFQFAYQWIYKDGFESAISVYSDIVVPRRRLNQGNLPSPSYDYDNVIHVEVPTGTEEVEKIRILGRDGDKKSLIKIDEVLTSENSSYNGFQTWDSSLGKYYFYNNRITTGVSSELINKQYDNVPRVAQAQTTSNNRLFYGNYVEGYDNVKIEATITPVYDQISTGDDLGVTIQPGVRISVGELAPTQTDNSVLANNSKHNAGATYIIDFSDVQEIQPNSTINISMSVAPNNNFHFFRHQGYTPSNKNQPVNESVDEFTSNLVDVFTSSDTSNLGIPVTYTYYNGTGTQTADGLIGAHSSAPLIIKGGTLLFKVEFTYLGPLITDNASGFLADLFTYFIHKDPGITLSQIEEGLSFSSPQVWDLHEMGWLGYSEEDWNDYITNIDVKKIASYSYDLGLGVGYDTENQVNFIDTITAGKPRIGYNNNQSSAGIAGTSLNDDNASLIFPIVDTDDMYGIPLGYGVVNKIDCHFKLRYVAKDDGEGTKREFMLELNDITDSELVTVRSKPTGNTWNVVNANVQLGVPPNIDQINEYFDNASSLSFDISSFLSDDYVSKIKRQWGYLNDLNPIGMSFAEVYNYDSFQEAGYPGIVVSTGIPVQRLYYTFDGSSGFANQITDGAPAGRIGWCLFDGEVGIGGRGANDQPYQNYRFYNSGSILKILTYIGNNQVIGGQVIQGDSAFRVVGGPYFSGFNLNLTLIKDSDNSYRLNGRPSYMPLMLGDINTDPSISLTQVATYGENTIDGVYLDPNDYNTLLTRPEIEIVNSLASYFGLDTFGKYKSFKSSSYHDFGVVYYDERGRHGFVNHAGSVYVTGYSDVERPTNKGRASVTVTVNNDPPDWAVRWKLVHSKSTSIDSFIQYTAGGAFVRPDNSDAYGTGIDTNVYVSLNYLQESQISYASAFGARSPEGSILLYSFQPGDKVRVISYEVSGSERLYPKDYVFEIADVKFLATEENPLHNGNDNPDFNKTGQFLILRNNNNANGFSFDDVKDESDFWGNNCIIEIFRPSKDKESLVYREVGPTFYINPTASTGSEKHQCPVSIDDGDVWFRRMAVNMRKYIGNEYVDLLVDTLDDSGSNMSQPNFESFFLESQTSTDLLKADSTGEGRPNIEVTEFGESRNENSVIYSEPTSASSKVIRYSSFNNSLLNFKDLNGSFGDIRFLADKGDHIVAILEDKCVQLPIGRKILSTSSGNDMVTSSTDVIGDEIFFDGIAGCGDHPESVAVAYDSIYFAHNGLGKVYRLSSQGVQDISSSGVSSFIRQEFGSVTSTKYRIAAGGFDYMNDEYLLTVKELSYHAPLNIDPPGVNYYCGGNGDLWKSTCEQTSSEEGGGDTVVPGESQDVHGCIDPESCTYNPDANVSDGSCTYPESGYDCDGNPIIAENYGPEEGQKKVSDYVSAYGLKYGDLWFLKETVFNGGTLFQYLNNFDFNNDGSIGSTDLLLFLGSFDEKYSLDDYIIEPETEPNDEYQVNLNQGYLILTDQNGYHYFTHVLLNTQESINDWGINLTDYALEFRVALLVSSIHPQGSNIISVVSSNLNDFLSSYQTDVNYNESLKDQPIVQS